MIKIKKSLIFFYFTLVTRKPTPLIALAASILDRSPRRPYVKGACDVEYFDKYHPTSIAILDVIPSGDAIGRKVSGKATELL